MEFSLTIFRADFGLINVLGAEGKTESVFTQ